MKTEASLQKVLHERLNELRTKNPQYSTRAFAKKLGISSGAMSEILNGTRVVSRKIATRFCDRLLLDPVERSQVLGEFPESKKTLRANPEVLHYLKLSMDQFKMMSEWYYFAILSLMQTADFVADIAWVAQRLGLTKTTATQAVDRLCRLNVIKIEADGRWTRSSSGHRTTDDFANLSIQKAHTETLEMSLKALENRPVEERDFTSLTLPLDYEDLPEAKQMIRKFYDEFYQRFNNTKKPKETERTLRWSFPPSSPSSPSPASRS